MLRSTLPLVLSLCLVACGGGSGASRPETPAPAPNQAPTAAFAVSPDRGSAPLIVSLDATTSSDADGTVSHWNWNFGDGETDEGETVVHTFRTAGTFEVVLTVRDDDGATATSRANIVVEPPPGTFTLRGEIRAQSGSVVDSDTNDRFNGTTPNNGFDSAQPVPNPATVGGYVAEADAGDPGAVRAEGDRFDVFTVSARGGETLLLSIGELGDGNDLDLYLYDADRNELAASIGTGEAESLEIPAPGDYFVEVYAFSGASTYVLSVGETAAPAGTQALRTTDAFAPDEALLGPRSGAAPTALVAETLAHWGRAGSRVRLAAGRGPAPHVLPGAPRVAPGLAAKLETLLAIKEVQRAGSHRWAEPNYLRTPFLAPNDQFFPNQWHYSSVKLPQAWEFTTGDPSVVVAVVDTGILRNHPEFAGKLVDGFDFISRSDIARDGDGRDDDPTDEGDGDLAGTSSFHGSHVAGTVAAATDNGDPGGGGAGAGWQTRVMPLRALGVGGGLASDVIEAVRYAAGLDNASGRLPSAPADVINLSLGGAPASQAEQNAFDQVRDAGVIVIAAAGNDASSAPSYPAAYENVVSVSATTITNDLAFYSNFGSTIDVAAPGGDGSTDVNGDGIADGVISTVGDESVSPPRPAIGVLAGTSMAAPHVAGIAALMKAVYPSLTPEQFDVLLSAGRLTDDLGPDGRDDFFGHGIINARKAVLEALDLAGTGGSLPAVLVPNPSTVNFGSITETLQLRVSNAGSEDTAVAAPRVVPAASWLTVTPAADGAADGTGLFELTVDRSGLADGLYAATLEFDYGSNGRPRTLSVPVRMQVTSVDLTADAGYHYVLVVDPVSLETIAFTSLAAADGLYRFELEDVPSGTWEIYAGTDSDNDGFICDAGEACGVFRTIDSPTPVEVSGPRTDLDFVTGFRTRLVTTSAASAARRTKRVSRAGEAGIALPREAGGGVETSTTP